MREKGSAFWTVLRLVLAVAWAASSGLHGDAWKRVAVLGEAGFQHAGNLDDIVVLPDGDRVLTSCRDGAVRLWELKSGKLLRSFVREEGGDVWGLLLLPGGREFLSAAEKGVVTRWDIHTGEEVMTYQHPGTAYRLALHPDGERFVATDHEKNVILWEIATGRKLRHFSGHTGPVYTAVFVAGGDRLLTGGRDGQLKVWNTATGQCERTLAENFDDLFTLALSPDGKRVAASSGDDIVRVYEAETLNLVWETKVPEEVSVVAWSPDGSRLAGGCDDGQLYLFDAGTGEVEKEIELPGGDHLVVAFSRDGKELFSGGDKVLFRWDWARGERVLPTEGRPELATDADLVAVSANGGVVVTGGGTREVLAWEVASGQVVHRHSLPDQASALAASPVGTTIAVGTSGGEVVLVEATGGKQRQCQGWGRRGGGVSSLSFRVDGTRLAGSSGAHEVALWESATGRKVLEFAGHTDDVNAVAFSPGSGALVSASGDKTVRVWDGLTGDELQKLQFGKQDARFVTFFGDGRGFLAARRDSDLFGWIPADPVEVETLGRAELEALIKDLADNEFAVRRAAIETLAAQGSEVLPLLDEEGEDDPEVVYRLREIRETIRRAEVGSELEHLHSFDASIKCLAGNPVGGEWAAVVGSGVRARVVLGDAGEGKLRIREELCDGRSPVALAFSGDGTTLAVINADRTVSVFRR